jgi:hypothetical protein
MFFRIDEAVGVARRMVQTYLLIDIFSNIPIDWFIISEGIMLYSYSGVMHAAWTSQGWGSC